MKSFEGKQTIKQLEKRKGGYFYLKIQASVVSQFIHKKATRLVCSLNNRASFRCGLNHLGDGNFYIIISGKLLNTINKKLGEEIAFRIDEDPDQLGVEMPEVLTVFLDQDRDSSAIFDQLTNGKKRSLIHRFIKIKDIDKQLKIIIDFFNSEKRT